MPFPSVTYTFTNGTTADATQVNQNFTDLINALSDTTKNISVSAGTFAGTLNASANTILGSSSSNTITFNASVSSNIPVGTNTTYDLGSSTLGFRSLYIGGTSTFTTRFVGGTQSASITYTLPTAVAAFTQYVLSSDASGVLSWTSRNAQQLSTKTAATYSIVGGDDAIIADATSNSITITLPAPSSFSGRIFRIKRFDATYAAGNTVTIARNGTEKIDGTAASLILSTQGEALSLVTNGTDWFILDHDCNTSWTSFGMTINGSTSNPTKGTTARDGAWWRRDGDVLWMRYEYQQTAAGSAGSGTYEFLIPNSSSWTIDTNKTRFGVINTEISCCGYGEAISAVDTQRILVGTVTTNTSVGFQDNGGGAVGSSLISLGNATARIAFVVQVPITNWFA